MVAKDDEILWLLSIPPLEQVSQDFSTMLAELYVSHWEKVKQYRPSLQPMLRFISEAQSLCVEANALISSSMLVIGPKFPVAQDLI